MAKGIVPGIVLVAAYYAVFGGEYSLLELRSARAAVEVEREALAGLEHEIDSLAAWSDSLSSDEATLERIAREQFGMIREGETLYRFATPSEEPEDTVAENDTGGSSSRSRPPRARP